jgi:hypothetical protein
MKQKQTRVVADCDRLFLFIGCELEHEIVREATPVALDLLIEPLRRGAV